MDSRLRGNDSGGDAVLMPALSYLCLVECATTSFPPKRESNLSASQRNPQIRAGRYQFKRNENWIWREFSAELIYPKLEVP